MTRIEAVRSRLERGPATVAQMVTAAGYAPGSATGKAYVRIAVARLRRRGYVIVSQGSPGSHRGCVYVMIATCPRCGGYLARDNWRGGLCSPCERAAVDAELAAVTA